MRPSVRLSTSRYCIKTGSILGSTPRRCCYVIDSLAYVWRLEPTTQRHGKVVILAGTPRTESQRDGVARKEIGQSWLGAGCVAAM